MALDKDALSELLDALRAGGDLDVVRAGMQLVAQALIDLEATEHIGAGPYERTDQRITLATIAVGTGVTVIENANITDLRQPFTPDPRSVGTLEFKYAAAAPFGTLLLDGSSFNGNRYKRLADFLGGTTLPDMRGRVPVGSGAGSGLTPRSLGDVFGAESHQLTEAQIPAHTHSTPNHTHSASTGTAGSHSHGGGTGWAGSHTHTAQGAHTPGGSGAALGSFVEVPAVITVGTSDPGNHQHSINSDGSHSHSVSISSGGGGTSGSAGGGGTHPNTQPSLVWLPVIRV